MRLRHLSQGRRLYGLREGLIRRLMLMKEESVQEAFLEVFDVSEEIYFSSRYLA